MSLNPATQERYCLALVSGLVQTRQTFPVLDHDVAAIGGDRETPARGPLWYYHGLLVDPL